MSELIQIEVRDDRYFIDTSFGEVEITEDELRPFQNSIEKYVENENKLYFDPTTPARRVGGYLNTEITEELEDFSEPPNTFTTGLELRQEIQQSCNPVLLDSTTFYEIERLLIENSGGVDTLRMFDLNVFINAVILFDDIYVTSGADVSSMNEALGESIFNAIPQGSVDEANFHYFIWTSIKEMLQDLPESEIRTLKESWAALLDIDVEQIEFDWSDADQYINTPITLFSDQGRHLDPIDNRNSNNEDWLTKIISISTYRTYYNHELSRKLGLVYLSNALRGPIHHHLLSDNKKINENWDIILNAFSRQHQEDIQQSHDFLGKTVTYQLPMFFSMVINRADSPEDIIPVLCEIRDESARYRARSQQLIHSLSVGNLEEIDRLQRAINETSDNITPDSVPSVEASIPLQADVPILPSAGMEIVGALKLLTGVLSFVDKHGRDLYWRLRHPHYHFLTNVRDEAREFTAAQPAIEMLWGDSQQIDYQFLDRLKSNYPYFE